MDSCSPDDSAHDEPIIISDYSDLSESDSDSEIDSEIDSDLSSVQSTGEIDIDLNSEIDIDLSSESDDNLSCEDIIDDEEFARQLQEEEWSHGIGVGGSNDIPNIIDVLGNNFDQPQHSNRNEFINSLMGMIRETNNMSTYDLVTTAQNGRQTRRRRVVYSLPIPVSHPSVMGGFTGMVPMQIFDSPARVGGTVSQFNNFRNTPFSQGMMFPPGLMFENNSYEFLSQLSEIMGNVSKGANNEEINNLPVSKYSVNDSVQSTGDVESCVICTSELVKDKTDIITLPCKHFYCKECIIKWLKINKECPICKRSCLMTSSSPEESSHGGDTSAKEDT